MRDVREIPTIVVSAERPDFRLDATAGIFLTVTHVDPARQGPVATQPGLVIVVEGGHLDVPSAVRTARRIHGRSVPLLAIVAADAEAEEAALLAGASDVIARPLRPLVLARRIANVVAQGSQAALEAQEEELVDRLARVGEYRDSDTGEHVQRMARYCWIIADELGFDKEQCRFLSLAAQMHDIGKVGIPDGILRKTGRLTPEEFDVMKRHTLIGQAMLKNSRSPLLQLAEIISVTHHERWDGSGYPFGLEGEVIPIAGRIAAVADVFDAVTSARCYKGAWSSADARTELLAGRGTLFDPACVDAMLRRWDEVIDVIPRRDAA
jgi:response regulator RpfG family c-di-GMP phosphodiesterase